MIDWKTDNAKYANGDLGYLGKYNIFNVYWDSSGNEKKYALSTKLPGLRQFLGNFKTQDDAKFHAERALELWISNAGINK